MSFLQPFVLAGLALAALPIVIHLLNRLRHRSVEWGAMSFLLQASRRTRGHARLRHLLIMAARMLAIAALVLGIARPLSSGWVGTLNASVDTAVIVLDRSPSMARQDLQSGLSARSAAVQSVVETLKAGGVPSNVVLVDSGSGKAVAIESLDVLAELPDVGPSDAPADIPGLLQTAVEYLQANEAGRTEIWLCSDGQRPDWSPDSARWEALRTALGDREKSVRVHVLHAPPTRQDNLGVRVENLRRVSEEGAESLLLDVIVTRHGGEAVGDRRLELGVVLNGARSVLPLQMDGEVLRLRDHRLPLSEGEESGWGKIELPEDENPRDNAFFFAYGPQPRPHCLIVSDEPALDHGLRLAVAPAADFPARVQMIRPSDLGTVDWSEPALVLWHSALPVGSAREALQRFVESDGTVLFLAPEGGGGDEFLGCRWGDWTVHAEPETIEWWPTQAGLLRSALDGRALPVGEVQLHRTRALGGPQLTQLAQHQPGAAMFWRRPTSRGGVYFLGTGIDRESSNAVEQGVVLFVLVQRALEEGERRLSSVLDGTAGEELVSLQGQRWDQLAGWREGALSTQSQLVAGVYQVGDKMAVRNRPLSEDEGTSLVTDEISALLQGVDHRVLQTDLESGTALVQEIWRVFLGAMLIALVLEALLSLPKKARA